MAAGHKSSVYKTGTSTSTTNEAMNSYLSSDIMFEITNRDKAIIDISAGYTFYEDAVAIDESDIESIDQYIGIVTFATSKTGTITATYNYFLKTEVCAFQSASLDINFNLADNTVLCTDTEGYKTYEETIKEATASLDGFVKQDESIDDEVLNDDGLIVVIQFTDYIQIAAKLKLSSASYDTAVEELVTNSYSLMSDGEVQFYLS